MKGLLAKNWVKATILYLVCGMLFYYFGVEEGHGREIINIYYLFVIIAFVGMLGLPFAIDDYKKGNSRLTRNDLAFHIICYLISLVLIALKGGEFVSIVFLSISLLGYSVIVVMDWLISKTKK